MGWGKVVPAFSLPQVLTLENTLLSIHPFQKLFSFFELLIFDPSHIIAGPERAF